MRHTETRYPFPVHDRCDDQCDDRGAVGAWLVIALSLLLVAFLAFLVDGGAAFAARGQARSLAEQAARAGATAVNRESLRGPSPAALRLEPAAADARARQFLAAEGATGEVSVAATSVTVTARIQRRTLLLSALGIDRFTGTGTATATLIQGTNTGDTP